MAAPFRATLLKRVFKGEDGANEPSTSSYRDLSEVGVSGRTTFTDLVRLVGVDCCPITESRLRFRLGAPVIVASTWKTPFEICTAELFMLGIDGVSDGALDPTL